MSQTIAFYVLAVIGGVPLYALIGGYVRRVGLRVPLDWTLHPTWCPSHESCGERSCECGRERSAAALLWPVVLAVVLIYRTAVVLIYRTVRAVLYVPARAAYRAALREPRA